MYIQNNYVILIQPRTLILQVNHNILKSVLVKILKYLNLGTLIISKYLTKYLFRSIEILYSLSCTEISSRKVEEEFWCKICSLEMGIFQTTYNFTYLHYKEIRNMQNTKNCLKIDKKFKKAINLTSQIFIGQCLFSLYNIHIL